LSWLRSRPACRMPEVTAGANDREETVASSQPFLAATFDRPDVLDDDAVANGRLAVGTGIRLKGLTSAAHLNGQVATVLRHIPEKNRYEVELCKDADIKSVALTNIEPLGLLDEVTLWRDELVRPDLRPSEARPILARLQVLDVTMEVLQKTKIGKVVNEVGKRHADHDGVAGTGRQLVKNWREMYQRMQALAAATPPAPSPGAPAPLPTKDVPSAPPVPERKRVVGAIDLREQSKFTAPSRTGQLASGEQHTPPVEPSARAQPIMPEIDPMSRAGDADRIVGLMRTASNDHVRIAILMALDRTPLSHLPAFVSAGGLALLERWIRTRDECRFACLTMLQKIPLNSQDLRDARIPSAVSDVARLDTKSDCRKKATAILETWRATGVLATAKTSAQAGEAEAPVGDVVQPPDSKRARLVETTLPVASAPDLPPAPEVPLATPQPPGLPENCPPELAQLDPRITDMLVKNPSILNFLAKHRSVMQNLNADNLKFLTRNLRNLRSTQADSMFDEMEVAARTVMVSNLHPEATEDDISTLFDGYGVSRSEVSLPRESRKRRSCCVATVVLPTRDTALEVIRELQGVLVRGRQIRVESAAGAGGSPRMGYNGDLAQQRAGGDCVVTSGVDGRRIKWKQNEDLWRVVLFDRGESVVDFGRRLESASAIQPPPAPADDGAAGAAAGGCEIVAVDAASPAPETGSGANAIVKHAKFQAAAKREHEEERKMVREALARAAADGGGGGGGPA